MRIPIDYTISQTFSTKDGWWTVYYFYPDDEWDEDKLSIDEAIKKYPKTHYDWCLFGDDK